MADYLQRAPFIRILLPYIAGIVIAAILPDSTLPVFIILAVVLLVTLVIVNRKPGYYRNICVGGLITLFLCCAAVAGVLSRNKSKSWHEDELYSATLLEKPVEKANSYRAEVLVTRSGHGDTFREMKERIIIYFKKGSCIDSLYPGVTIIFSRNPQKVENSGNPWEFDYQKYMQRLGIERQVYLTENDWQVAGKESRFRLRIVAEKTRDRLMAVYSRNGMQGAEYEILSALTLGYKKSLDQDIRDAFKATGSMHVLAVSGLHVGIVYLVFNMVFGFMRRRKTGKILFLVLAVTALWMFAFLTGLSPSVQRSALMFSLVLVGENLRRPSNIYNTLASSAFILLVINPGFLFDVGFQLSYAAVAGIVYFQPRLSSLISSESKVTNYFRDLLTVTISAQLATFPLTCYYFQQFPVYFWLANFFVIPGAFAFIIMGVLILITSPIPVIPGILATVAGFFVRALFGILQFIENLPGALLTGFRFTVASLAISFFIIMACILFLEFKKTGYLMAMAILLVAFFISDAMTKIIQNHHSEIIAYKLPEPVLHLISGRSNYLLAPGEVLKNEFPERESKAVSMHYRLREPVIIPLESDYSDHELLKQGNLICFKGQVIAFQKGHYHWDDSFSPDIVIVPPGQKQVPVCPGNVVVVSYNRSLPNNSGPGEIYFIHKKGAWIRLL